MIFTYLLTANLLLTHFPQGTQALDQPALSEVVTPQVFGGGILLVDEGEILEAQTSRTFGTIEMDKFEKKTLVPFAPGELDILKVRDQSGGTSFAEMVFRIHEAPRIVATRVLPALREVGPGENIVVRLVGIDQFGRGRLIDDVVWLALGGSVTEDGSLHAWDSTVEEPLSVTGYPRTKPELRSTQTYLTTPAPDALALEKGSLGVSPQEKLAEEIERDAGTQIVRRRCLRVNTHCLLEEFFTDFGALKTSLARYSTGKLMELLRLDRRGVITHQLTCSAAGEVLLRLGDVRENCSI